MKIRAILASLFVVSFGAVPAIAQVCDPAQVIHPRYRAAEVPPVVYGNPCAPYAWCGPRDAWGNPVYAAPAYTPYPQVYGYSHDHGTVVYETLEPRVNGWTGAVEYGPANPYGGLITY
jgi:hypothetical protein